MKYILRIKVWTFLITGIFFIILGSFMFITSQEKDTARFLMGVGVFQEIVFCIYYFIQRKRGKIIA